MDRRSETERRSGKDRRYDYDEQRKTVRHKLNKNVSVVLTQQKLFVLRRQETTKFAAIDVSMGGLRAQYVGPDMHQYEKNILSIETDDGNIKIEDIPFKVITDYKFTRLPDNSYLRRCGIKFGELSEYNKTQINKLIEEYT
jgi:YD repeat-containing protein